MTQLRKRICRRKLKELACQIVQRVCIGVGLFGLALCIFAEAIAKNPVSTLVLAIVYFLLGISFAFTGYVGYKFFIGLERKVRRNGREQKNRSRERDAEDIVGA